MEVMLRRTNFRDYYDIYSILKTGVAIHEIIALSLEYSGHRLRTKNLLAILTNGQRFERDSRIHHLQPKYQISAQEIESYIKDLLATNRDISLKQG